MEDEIEVKKKKQGNNVPTWGNTSTMNINNMVHTNILSSPYFKKNLFALKTYHEVVDEIYYKVCAECFFFEICYKMPPKCILTINSYLASDYI